MPRTAARRPGTPRSQRSVEAIPATYHGVTYRSRLEARWAVWMDSIAIMGIKHYYEHEGCLLPSSWYSPEFYLRVPLFTAAAMWVTPEQAIRYLR